MVPKKIHSVASETFQVLIPACFKSSPSSAAMYPVSYHIPLEYLQQNTVAAISTLASSLSCFSHPRTASWQLLLRPALSCLRITGRLVPADRLPGVLSRGDNGAFISLLFAQWGHLFMSLSSLLGCWLPLSLLKFSSYRRASSSEM